MKNKKRTKWSKERAKILDDLRKTKNLTWSELAKKEQMSAGALKASMDRYLKVAPKPEFKPQPAPQSTIEKDKEQFRALLQKRVDQYKAGYQYWSEVMVSELME